MSSMMYRPLSTLAPALVAVLAAGLAAAPAAAATMQPVASFGANPGALAAYEYVPDALSAGAPLVVVLHGCTQSASAMASAGWQALADEHGFAVLYPEQTTANNPLRCFNWMSAGDLARGQGENASIMAMVDHAIATHGLDPARVYITGFSAGAAFTAVMLATWPDRFAAGAIMSGVPYRCAATTAAAYGCMNPGVDNSPTQWGDLVRTAAGSHAGPWPRVQVWQGVTDTTVAATNATELVEQWADVHGLPATPDATSTIGRATLTQHTAGGVALVEAYRIEAMPHAISIGADPLGACSGTPGAYFTDTGVCSTLRAAAFFGLVTPDGGGGTGGGTGGGGGSGAGSDGPDDGGPDAMEGGCSAGGSATGGPLVLLVLALARRWRRPTTL